MKSVKTAKGLRALKEEAEKEAKGIFGDRGIHIDFVLLPSSYYPDMGGHTYSSRYKVSPKYYWIGLFINKESLDTPAASIKAMIYHEVFGTYRGDLMDEKHPYLDPSRPLVWTPRDLDVMRSMLPSQISIPKC